MQRPRFSEMLMVRRRQLGLTLTQASKVLKLREPVLVAFEEGDFANIPKSGYAQGMLSSYARYLGLNPREVVGQFQQDLYEFENGVTSHDLRRKTREGRSMGEPTYELPEEEGGYEINYPTNSLLQVPTVLGTSDAFTPTSHARTRSERWQQSSPLVNPYKSQDYGWDANSTNTYGSTQTTMTSINRPVGAAREQDTGFFAQVPSNEPSDLYSQSSFPQGRPYTQRPPRTSRSSMRSHAQRRGLPQTTVDTSALDATNIIKLPVTSTQYTDDLRYDETPQGFKAAYTQEGRARSRNIANKQRPQVARRNGAQGRSNPNARSRSNTRRPGVMGFFESYFSDRRRTIITAFIALALVLIVVIATSVRSCVSKASDTPKNVPVAQDAAADASKSADQAAKDAAEKKAADDAAAKAAAEAAAKEAPKQVSVTVSVADGQYAWLEIKLDDKSVVAESKTGPWSETYDVKGSITIQTNKPSAVTVQKNGEDVAFENKASGVGTITIEGPKKDSGAKDGQDAKAADGKDAKAADTSKKDSKASSSSSSGN